MSEQTEKQDFEGWCVVELLGHRRLAGYVTVEEVASVALLRVDTPTVRLPSGQYRGKATQYVNPSSLYALTPTTEGIARAIASTAPEPVNRWEFEAIEARSRGAGDIIDPLDDGGFAEDRDGQGPLG